MSQPHEFDFEGLGFGDDAPIPLKDPDCTDCPDFLASDFPVVDLNDVIAEIQQEHHNHFLLQNSDGGSAPLWGGAQQRFERLTDAENNQQN